MGIPRPVPAPPRIRAYLTAHGWRKGWDITGYGEMFVYSVLDDNGEEITAFVPVHDIYDDYAHCVSSVVDTLAAVERRPKDAVWADLCGIEAATATPPAPATPTPVDPVTP